MKSRGSRSGKPGSRRKRGATDVSPSTSLPPLVEGQLRCFLRVTVGKILWTVPRPPQSVLVRLRWWGETSDGTIFHPRNTSHAEQKSVKTTTRYAVRCGPKQFTSYLTDMGALVLEVMTRLDHLPLGRAQISGISRLSPAQPISGFFTVVSPTSEKLGELQVSVALEPLSETYDSNSSLPNTDVSLDAVFSGPQPKSDLLQPSMIPRGRHDSETSRASTPRGRDHLYFKQNTESNRDPLRETKDQSNLTSHTFREKGSTPDQSGVSTTPTAKDLLSVLLQQGSKLRDAMAESATRLEPNADLGVEPLLPPVLEQENYTSQDARVPFTIPSSRIRQNLLNFHKDPPSRDVILHRTEQDFPELEVPGDTRAIELLLGSSPVSLGQFWDGTGSPPESMAGSDFYESELNDPHYDQSLLENLFYSAPKPFSDVSSDEDQSRAAKKGAKSRAEREEEGNTKQSQSNAAEEEEPLSLKLSGHKSEEASFGNRVRSDAIDLSVDRLALLGRMHSARVIVESLKVKPESTQVTPSKRSSKGKPPRPASSSKRTYFVEFQFPVSSKSKSGEVSVATEITRLVSSKIVNGTVKFQQRFVFPVLFGGHMIKHWWNSDLTFRIFLRKGTQQKPLLLGSSGFRLRDVLRSEDLSCSCSLPVRSQGAGQEMEDVGPLKVSVAIAGEGRDFSSVLDKPSGVAREASPSSARRSVRIAEPEIQTNGEISPEPDPPPTTPLTAASRHVAAQEPPPAVSRETPESAEENGLLLHVLLMVPEGKGLTPVADGPASCNPYLNCKLFSSQEASRSSVVWGSSQPVFSFSQVAPVTLTSRLLERMKNNVMIIEVWNKVSSPGSDHLLGLAKLPLHQFYMSFSDQKICRLLLQAQYPVVAVDSFVPVIDVFSGAEQGRLKVLLAMGSGDQVVALQRLRNEEEAPLAPLLRPAHCLDPPQPGSEMCRAADVSTDHVFEIHVESVKGLTPLQSTVWGEADCYVQYYFPVQSSVPGPGDGLPETGITLKAVRTATTLCVPDPVFNDRQSHTLVAPSETPVQRLLLSAYSMQGLSGGGGVTFEIWCRYYYPNVRDQMVAKAVLPLSRLCAMVTMHHREEVGIQAFCLPLTLRSESPTDTLPASSGLLNVNVTYRRSLRSPVGMLATRMVSISVQIHRATGLQAAARALAEQDPSFQYSADVGVNAFIIIRPSFLPEVESRNTRTVARSFCPEFDHHSEFPCNIVTQKSSGEACSLAEILHFSEIVMSIHHQSVTPGGVGKSHPAHDHHLGVVRIAGRDLLAKRSGISGWYPVMLPEDSSLTSPSGVLSNVVGGLELSVGFAHHSDRERVLEVARGLGWSEEEEEISGRAGDDWEKEDLVNLSITIPKIWLPVRFLLLAGHKQVHKKTYCYLRYKVYDRDAICSPLSRPVLSEDGQQATVAFEQTRSLELLKHQPLVWYLREEKLEIQVWRSYGKDTGGPRPQDTDRLLGSAYVDMTTLAANTSRTLSVSGVYPLFKRNVASLQGAAVRVHLSLGSAYHPSVTAQCTSSAEDHSLSEEEAALDISMDEDRRLNTHAGGKKSFSRPDQPPTVSEPQPNAVDLENTFAANIVVERAMHLSLKGSPLTEREVSNPSCCVSFPVAGSATPVTTPIIENTESPMWNFQQQTRLPKELLVDPQQTLVFKVWHRSGDVERVLGFASVDLSPLLSGFQSVCGWYNIGDFSGQCQGQMKVSVTPLESIAHLREERLGRSRTAAAIQSQVTPHSSFLYQPSPMYTFPLQQQTLDMADGVITPTDRRGDAFPATGIEEDTQAMRRIQESLHRAEQSTRSVEQLDILSQSSRTSLLSTLRKNLSELDDIQKYFNQKLYRSLSGTAPPGGTSVRYSEIKPHTATDYEETDAQLLLRKSNLLVSQVSSLITDLQEKALFRETPPSTTDGTDHYQHHSAGGTKVTSVQQVNDIWPDTEREVSDDDEMEEHCVDTPPFSAAGSPVRQDHNVKHSTREESVVVDPEVEEQEHDLQEDSEEEYEENLIEPRTLNEFTALTDRTSPWSSMISEPEHEVTEQNPQRAEEAPEHFSTNGILLEKLDLSSSIQQDDQNSNPSSVRSFDHQLVDSDPGISEYNQPEMCVESEHLGTQWHHEDSSDISDGGEMDRFRGDLKVLSATQASNLETLLGASEQDEFQDLDGEEEEVKAEYKSGYSSSSHHESSSQRNTSPSVGSSEDLPDMTEDVAALRTHLLSDPIQLPNFFLPPQHLEASMRLLSQSPVLPSSSAHKADEAQIARGIPFRRRPRQTPKITTEELPKEETKRIARIFAAQFPNKK
ncbi:C2 domain-containing protein 3 [Hyperolius riggenbachi]|uniref:C2 domain-containing protein 3 n=1 Tax=Hyperolius riggenbachi TaxID=752182 RepID=UPI0035A308FC